MKMFERSVNSDHIRSNSEGYRDGCSKIMKCIDFIYSREDVLIVLGDKNIRLNKICDAIIGVKTSNSTVDKLQCSEEGRTEILQSLKTSNEDSWKTLGDCLDQHYGNATRRESFKEICSLAQATQNNCLNTNSTIQAKVETVWNAALDNDWNTCKDLVPKTNTEISCLVYIVIVVSIFVLLALISCLVLFYSRRMRKSKRSSKIVSNIYDQLYQEVKVKSDPRPSEVSNWSYVSVGSTILEDDKSCLNLIDPECQRFQLNNMTFDSSARVDCKVVPSTPGKPAGDVALVSVCQYCHLEQDMTKVLNNHCLYCHANLTTGKVQHRRDSAM